MPSKQQSTIDIVFNGVDKTAQATQSALDNVGKFSGDIAKATQPFQNATVAALKYEAAIIAVGAAVTAFSVKAASDFQAGFGEVSTLITAPTEDIARFREEVIAYAEGSTGSLADVNSAVYAAISAGVDYRNSLALVSEAERLSIAGKADLSSTLTVLISSLNAYGLSTEEAGRFSDLLFNTVKEGQTTLPQLNASLAQVTTTAANVGVPFSEILAATAALTKAGTPTANAITQINSVIKDIITPSQQAAAAAQRLGLDFSAAGIESNGLAGTLQLISEATGGNKDAIAELIPTARSLRAVFPLLGESAGEFARILESNANSAGVTGEAYDKLADNLSNVGKRLSSSFEVLLVQIGDPLLDSVGDVGNAIGEIFSILAQSFAGGDDEIVGTLSGITKFIEEEFENLADFLTRVAAALPAALENVDVSGFANGLTAVKDAISGLFQGIDLTDADDLARAITFIGQAFEGLSNFTAGAIGGLEPFIRFIGELAVQGVEARDAAEGIGRAFGQLTALGQAAGAVSSLSGAVSAALGVIALNQGANLLFALKGIGGALLGGTGAIAALGALASAIAAVQAAVDVSQGGSGDNFINSILNPFGGEDISTYVNDFIVWIKGLGTAAEEVQSIDLVPGGASGDQLLSSAPAFAKAYEDIAKSLFQIQEKADAEPIDRFAEAQKKLNDLAGETAPILLELGDSFTGPSEKARELAAAMESSNGTFSVVSSGATRAADSLRDFSDASEETRLRLAEAAIAASGAIEVARIEADADRAVAAFESINATVNSTGDLIGNLFGQLGDENISKFDKLGIKERIADEAEARDRILSKQEKLLSAEIKRANQQARAFARGDALIKVEGDGLQPHLEAIMFELFEAIQLRVNADGYKLLLGAV